MRSIKRVLMHLALTLTAATGVVALTAGAAQATAFHAGCGPLNAHESERCAFTGSVTHFSLSGTGKFSIQLPYGPLVYSHYVSYQNWQAYTTGPGDYGNPHVINQGCCYEYYWNGWVW